MWIIIDIINLRDYYIDAWAGLKSFPIFTKPL